MIRGVQKDEKRPMGKHLFLFQIVANKQTGMDVDKYDYLLRDAMFCGAKIAFDISRLLWPQVRKDGENFVLAYYHKEEWMIHQLFRSRFDMHHQVYGHSVVMALNIMVEEVLLLAKDWMQITKAITDPGKDIYLRLTDSVLYRIECLDWKDKPFGFTEELLKKTQNLVRRIKQRDLYTSALRDMSYSPEKMNARIKKGGEPTKPIEEQLVELLVKKQEDLKNYESEFKVVVTDRDFTRRSENPLLHVPFYSNRHGTHTDKVEKLTEQDMENSTQPAHFWERYVRVYIKDRKADDARGGKLKKLLKQAFDDLGPLDYPSPKVPTHADRGEDAALWVD